MRDDVTVEDLEGLTLRWTFPLDVLGTENVKLAVDGAGTMAVVVAGWEPVPRALVIDLAGGTLVDRVEPLATTGLYGGPHSVLCHDRGWRGKDRRDPPRILELSRASTIVEAVSVECQIISVAPDARELVLFEKGVISLRAWPGLAEIQHFHGYSATVDWMTRTLIFNPTTNVTEAWSFAERVALRRTVAIRPGEGCRAIGGGLLVPRWGGLTLVSIPHGWRREFLPALCKEFDDDYSLDASGTRVRFCLGGKPRVLGFGPATGQPLGSASPLSRRARKTGALFHPSLDVAVYSKSGAQPSVDLRLAAEGQPIVARLGLGAEPLAWTSDGRTLLLVRKKGGSRALEAWSIRR
jgi:hypothetical protein